MIFHSVNGAHFQRVQTITTPCLIQKQKETTFGLFVGIVGSYWVGEIGNYNQVSFTNTYANATFYITLNDSKFIHECKNKISNWGQYWKNKCTDLV